MRGSVTSGCRRGAIWNSPEARWSPLCVESPATFSIPAELVGSTARASTRRLWVVNHYAIPRTVLSGTRHFDLSRRLVERGYEVTIFAAGFSHMTGREERVASGRLFRSATFDGVRFVWLRTFPDRGNTWRCQLNMLSFLAVFVVVQSRWVAPDAIVGSTVHPFAAFGAWLVARWRGARFDLNPRSLAPDACGSGRHAEWLAG